MPRRATGLLLVVLAAMWSPANAATKAQKASDAALLAYLRAELAPRNPSLEDRALTATRVQVAWSDLSGDGAPEAIVFVSGGEWCGSGGCNLLILEQTPKSFRVRGDLLITRPPIGLLRHRTSGWRDVTVLVAGGGIAPGYRAVLPFDGRRYPGKPTVPPARRMQGGAFEEVVIPADVYPFLGR